MNIPARFTTKAPYEPSLTYLVERQTDGNYLISWPKAFNGDLGQCIYHHEVVQRLVQDGTWRVISDLTTKLPQKFKFKNKEASTVYTAELVENNTVLLTWESRFDGSPGQDSYPLGTVESFINNGTWIILEDLSQPSYAEKCIALGLTINHAHRSGGIEVYQGLVGGVFVKDKEGLQALVDVLYANRVVK